MKTFMLALLGLSLVGCDAGVSDDEAAKGNQVSVPDEAVLTHIAILGEGDSRPGSVQTAEVWLDGAPWIDGESEIGEVLRVTRGTQLTTTIEIGTRHIELRAGGEVVWDFGVLEISHQFCHMLVWSGSGEDPIPEPSTRSAGEPALACSGRDDG